MCSNLVVKTTRPGAGLSDLNPDSPSYALEKVS